MSQPILTFDEYYATNKTKMPKGKDKEALMDYYRNHPDYNTSGDYGISDYDIYRKELKNDHEQEASFDEGYPIYVEQMLKNEYAKKGNTKGSSNTTNWSDWVKSFKSKEK